MWINENYLKLRIDLSLEKIKVDIMPMTAGMEVNIIMLLNYMMRKKLLIKLLLWLRSLLAEHKIPDVVANRLKAYIPDLSENVPNIQLINKCLENDISYLNNKEELMYTNVYILS